MFDIFKRGLLSVPVLWINRLRLTFSMYLNWLYPGADPGFQVRGGGRTSKIFGVFRVKKITILRQKRSFWCISYEKSRFYAKNENFGGISCEKSRFYANHIFSNFRGGARRPMDPPLVSNSNSINCNIFLSNIKYTQPAYTSYLVVVIYKLSMTPCF